MSTTAISKLQLYLLLLGILFNKDNANKTVNYLPIPYCKDYSSHII